jgi:membrane-associated protein
MIELLQNLTSPEWLMQYGGLYFVALIVFAETGLFIGFFLPGDTLLFIAGMMIANVLAPFDISVLNLVYWVGVISAAGILGNYVGYWFGKRSGEMLFSRRDTWLFKKRHLQQAREFYEKKGGGAIVLARFLPIVRTFAPIIAGVVKMTPRKFSFYNIVGSFAWVGSILTAGYLLGENQCAKENLEKIIIGIVIITTAPLVLKMLKGRKKRLVPMVVEAKNGNEESTPK